MIQEFAALLIVALTAAVLARGAYRRYLAPGLARWLLRKGRVGLAMKVRGKAALSPSSGDSACSGCEKH